VPDAFRLLRYCARPPFALERLPELDAEHLIYDSAKPGSGATAPRLTPLELLERLAPLVPPPRVHRHRYYGVLARTAAHGKFPWRPRAAGVGRSETHAVLNATSAVAYIAAGRGAKLDGSKGSDGGSFLQV
jgi:hypothetical protein